MLSLSVQRSFFSCSLIPCVSRCTGLELCSGSHAVLSGVGGGGRKRQSSSAAWLNRHEKDVYATMAREQNLRSRAYFKLKEIQDKHRLITPSSLVVDLGAAPGGWSLLASDIIYKKEKRANSDKTTSSNSNININSNSNSYNSTSSISGSSKENLVEGGPKSCDHDVSSAPAQTSTSQPFCSSGINRNNNNIISSSTRICSIDLLPMDPIYGVNFIRGNFLDEVSQNKIIDSFAGRKATVVMSDMLHNTTGSKELDHIKSIDLCNQALEFCEDNLDTNGAFLCKYLNGKDESELIEYASSLFNSIVRVKPKASRGESSEIYLLCKQRKKS